MDVYIILLYFIIPPLLSKTTSWALGNIPCWTLWSYCRPCITIVSPSDVCGQQLEPQHQAGATLYNTPASAYSLIYFIILPLLSNTSGWFVHAFPCWARLFLLLITTSQLYPIMTQVVNQINHSTQSGPNYPKHLDAYFILMYFIIPPLLSHTSGWAVDGVPPRHCGSSCRSLHHYCVP